jgi:aspartate/methionine/tyrosine aminotransferase
VTGQTEFCQICKAEKQGQHMTTSNEFPATASIRLSDSVSRLQTESAYAVLARARALEAQGKRIIHLEIGEPDFATPPHIVEAGKRALDEGWTKYGPTPGLPDLREAIAAEMWQTRHVKVGADNVCVVPGAKPIIFFTMVALLEPGDEVIYPDPGFPIYESMIRFLRAVPVPIPLVEKQNFSFDLNIFSQRLSDKTKLVILNSPNNPTGGTIPEHDLSRMAAMLRNRNVVVLSDEIYSRIRYDDQPKSIASFDGMAERTVILDGFSKTYAMTGWRLGYGVMPTWLANAVNLLTVNSNSCTASFVQRAGLAALTGPQDSVTAMVKEFRVRRDAMVKGFNGIPGFTCSLPQGAFYAFPNVTNTGMSSGALADLLLNEAGVACLNGASFGTHGEGYLRFSYANSLPNILDALTRIGMLAKRWS